MINCLILEDEKSAIEVLNSYIDRTDILNNIGTYESGLDIPSTVLTEADVLFLDIQLPELDGLSYLKTLSNPPEVVVTTAFSDYALDAFEVAVLDYLLKPFSYDRFLKSVNRIVDQQELKKHKNLSSNFILYADKTMHKVNSEDIHYLKSEVDYVRVVTSEQHILILDSLHNWEKKLSALPFCRCHRSFIVNMERIASTSGNKISLEGKTIPIGRTYKAAFYSTFNNHNNIG